MRRIAYWLPWLMLLVGAALPSGWLLLNADPPARPVPAERMELTNPRRPNGYWLLRAAIELTNGRPSIDLEAPVGIAALRRQVDESRPALDIAREALRHDCRYPPITSFRQTLPDLALARALARLTAADSRCLRHDGQPVEALGAAVDAMELGVDLSQGGPAIVAMVGCACIDVGFAEAAAAVGQLDAAACRAAIARLDELESTLPPVAAILAAERESTLTCVADLFEQPRWRLQSGAFLGLVDRPVSRLTLVHERRAMARLQAYFDQAVLAAETAVPLPVPDPRDPVLQAFAMDWTGFLRRHASAQARFRVLRLALAVRAWRLDHGRPPARLGDLVPRYLDAVPDDPHAPPLSLRLLGGRAYSVGPNRRDDGGEHDPKPREDSPDDIAADG